MMKSQPLVTKNVNVLGNRVVANTVSEDEVIPEEGRPLSQDDCCLYERELRRQSRGQAGRHAKMGAEMGLVLL